MRYPLTFILLLLFSTTIYAQTIVGEITDQSGRPISSVTVRSTSLNTGTISDSLGNYTIQVAANNDHLVFSAVGFAEKEIEVAGRRIIHVMLQEDYVDLNEVVVIGYGSMKKKDLTGAVSTLSGDKLVDINGTQLSQELQGQIPGITVTRNSSLPGVGADIKVRGVTTISDSNPLIIVDGIPYTNIDDIAANDIEDITVLKDAASASIYGARAAAGVILITTKNAVAGATSLEANINVGIDRIPTFPRSVGATRYLQMANEAMWNDAGNPADAGFPLYSQDDVENWTDYNQTDPNNYPVTDWIDLLIRDAAPRQRYSLTFSHGGQQINSRISVNYEDTEALYDYRNYERVIARANNQVTFTDKLKANVDITLNRSVSNNPTSNPINSAHKYAPIYAALWTDGRIAGGKDGSNMYADIQHGGFDKSIHSKFNGRIALEYKPINSLTVTGTFSPFFHFENGKNFIQKLPWYDADDPTILGGYISGHNKTNLYETRAEVSTMTKQLIANYATRIDLHNLGLMGGYEDFTYRREVLDAQSEDFELSNFHYLNLGNRNAMFNTGNAIESAYRSLFGRILYDYDNRYYVQANFRYDGSSRFHPDHRWALFPSVSVGWSISEESFMKEVDGVSLLKIRGSYGSLGNERIGYYPYQSTIGFSTTPFYQGESIVSRTTAGQVAYAIQDISWETTESWNIGVDGGFFANRLSFMADYYVKRTRDMLLELEVPDYLGYENPDQNAGIMKTNGWELIVNWSDRLNENFRYSASVNLADYKSTMGNLGGTVFTGDQIIREGSEYHEWFGYLSDGLFQTQEQIDNGALLHAAVKPGDVRYRDVSGPAGVPDGVITPEYDKVLLGGSLPRFNYGGNLSVGYKAFDLSVIFQGVAKQTSRLAPNMIQPFESTWTSPSTYYDGNYWSVYNTAEQNEKARFPRLSHQSAQNNNYEMSDFWLFNGNYFRLKNITVGYNLPKTFLDRINLDRVRIYVSGTDLFSFNDYPQGYDPEAINSTYISTSYSIGLSVNFN